MSDLKILGKYTRKKYRCTLEDCGFEYEAGSNHYGEIYSLCPECKHLGARAHRSECITPLPEGWDRPQPWAMTTIADLIKSEIVGGKE